jgi:uncharacterized membrane protein
VVPALIAVALFMNGLAAGVMLGNAIGPAALALELSYPRYVELITYMWPRYDPFVPVLNVTSFALDIAITIAVSGHHSGAAASFALSAALLAALMAISLARNVPINKYVTSLDPASQPADWERRDPRAQWKKWNDIRVALALAALIAALAGASQLL